MAEATVCDVLDSSNLTYMYLNEMQDFRDQAICWKYSRLVYGFMCGKL